MRRLSILLSCVFGTMFFFAVAAFAGEKVFFYHNDPAGSPLAITDQNGNVVWRADYKPFGEVQSITGTIENNKQFIGKEKDKETGLHYILVRYYRDEIGRFISPDPVGPVDPKTSKTNYEMLLNPQKLNRYAYLEFPDFYPNSNWSWKSSMPAGDSPRRAVLSGNRRLNIPSAIA